MTDQKSELFKIIEEWIRNIPDNITKGDFFIIADEIENQISNLTDAILASGYVKIDELRAKQSFEDFMMEKHCEQFIGSKDAMVDDFADWCDGLSLDEWFEFGDKHIATNLPKLIK